MSEIEVTGRNYGRLLGSRKDGVQESDVTRKTLFTRNGSNPQ